MGGIKWVSGNGTDIDVENVTNSKFADLHDREDEADCKVSRPVDEDSNGDCSRT